MTFPDYGIEDRPAASLGRILRGGGLATMLILACMPVDGIAAQSDAITFTSPDNSEDYSITVTRGGVSETITASTDGSATATEAATALAAAITANTRLSAFLTADSAAGVVTITWRKGITGNVALVLNPSTAMALVTTAAAETQYSYGHVVERTSAPSSLPAGLHQVAVQKPAGSGTQFGVVFDDKVTEPEGVEEVTGPRAGTAMSVAFSNGNGNVVAVATGEVSVTTGAAVYVGSTGAEKGLVYDSTGSGRVLWAGASFESIGAPGVAHIQL